MRATWDAAAASPEQHALLVGPPETALRELDDLFGRLGADPRGGTCVEVGCGPGRMTRHLAERFERVVAVDVSPEMLRLARAEVDAPNVELLLVPGSTLEGVEDRVADVVVCYLVLQHLPRRDVALQYLREFARVLAPDGEAFVQLPVLRGARGRSWRAARAAVAPLLRSRRLTRQPAYRGVRLTEHELARGLRAAGLRAVVRTEEDRSPYRYAREVFLRLERA